MWMSFELKNLTSLLVTGNRIQPAISFSGSFCQKVTVEVGLFAN